MTQKEVVEKITEKILLNSTKEKLIETLQRNRDGLSLWISKKINGWLTTLILESNESFASYDTQELIEALVCRLEEKCC